MPRRHTDRVEDALAWLLSSLALLVLLAAILAGFAVHGREMARVQRENGERTPVNAVLLTASPVLPASQGSPWLAPSRVPASWTGPDGKPHTGLVTVRGILKAGATVRSWVDRSGALAPAPSSAASAGISAVIVALGVLGAGWTLLGSLWVGGRHLIAARNDARWTREWERVEPQWSRRIR
ncbi:hypothetical protein [Pseudonocardia acidicola]|uniref:Integral membrane protein n=1 Tax=Pseudonocardia acidicola TaxID=2724939 RepID=A0ABX1SES2_9PSEU|nr:hypothetical protein [Pseudonocardia acidicola]NMH99307.1 hypothetical protein [Pseudonocardia acidicola]